MDDPPASGPARPADMIDSKSESRPQGSNRLDATQPPGDRTTRDATGPAPELREQFGATRAAAIGLVKAHLELARAEFADILDEIKLVAILVGLAFVALFAVSLLLPIGLSLFIGETLFGSLGWGVLHGTLLLLGVAMAAVENPDVILMDVALGEMDGWRATQLIKSRPSTAHIPIIALTAHALASDRDRSISVGCADFDTKPVDLARLVGKIRACLMRKKARRDESRESAGF